MLLFLSQASAIKKRKIKLARELQFSYETPLKVGAKGT
jgi:hypothetical protein